MNDYSEKFFVYFLAVHQLMKDRLSDGLVNHNSKHCIICNPEASSSDLESGDDFHSNSKVCFIIKEK